MHITYIHILWMCLGLSLKLWNWSIQRWGACRMATTALAECGDQNARTNALPSSPSSTIKDINTGFAIGVHNQKQQSWHQKWTEPLPLFIRYRYNHFKSANVVLGVLAYASRSVWHINHISSSFQSSLKQALPDFFKSEVIHRQLYPAEAGVE